MAKNINSELFATLTRIQETFPQLSVKKEDLIKPTPNFLYDFYLTFVTELKKVLATFFGIPDNETNYSQGSFSKEVLLLRDVLKYGPKSYLNLMDFYEPTPKRTLTLLKHAMHFMAFLNNYADSMSEVHKEGFAKANLEIELRHMKQQYLDDMSEISKDIAEKEQYLEKLHNLEEEKESKHKQMLIDIENDKESVKKYQQRIKQLENNITMLNLQIGTVNREIENQEEKIAAATESEQLKPMWEHLKLEEAALDEHLEGFDLKSKFDQYQEMENNLRQLEDITFTLLPTQELVDYKNQLHQSMKEYESSTKQCEIKMAENLKLAELIKQQSTNFEALLNDCNKVDYYYNQFKIIRKNLSNVNQETTILSNDIESKMEIIDGSMDDIKNDLEQLLLNM